MTKSFEPGRRVSDSVIAERSPFAFEGVARFHGVEVFETFTRRVVVREPHEYTVGEDHFVDAFQYSIAQQLALAGTVAPQILHVLGRDGRGFAVVEEEVVGVDLDSVLRSLRARGDELPIEVAFAIASALVGLWKVPDDRGVLVPIYLGPRDIVVTPTGDVRARPQLVSERARQVVGAMAIAIDPSVAYLSPEQVGGDHGTTSGMFTLGLLLYELLATGHPIAEIETTTMMETLSKLRSSDLPSILERRWVPPPVTAFVSRLITRDPRARFGSWDDLLVALDAAHGELPPCGAADILAALPDRPQAPPAIAIAELGNWRALPHDGHVPISVQLAPVAASRDVGTRATLASDYHYGAEGRPMLRHGELLVDVRPVSQAEFARFALVTHRASFAPTNVDAAATFVSYDDARAYAAWAGKRLPTETEWATAVAALGAERLGVGEVWEWTTTPEHDGRVVRGGRWRNALDRPPHPDHRSYETGPAPDLGFRCVAPREDSARLK